MREVEDTMEKLIESMTELQDKANQTLLEISKARKCMEKADKRAV